MKIEQPILAYLLLTLFVGLKLTGNIDWSWLWVLSPLWLSILIPVVVAFIAGFTIAFRKAYREARNGRGGSKVERGEP